MRLNGTVIAVIARKNKIVGTQERGRRGSRNSVINTALGLTVKWLRSLMMEPLILLLRHLSRVLRFDHQFIIYLLLIKYE